MVYGFVFFIGSSLINRTAEMHQTENSRQFWSAFYFWLWNILIFQCKFKLIVQLIFCRSTFMKQSILQHWVAQLAWLQNVAMCIEKEDFCLRETDVESSKRKNGASLLYSAQPPCLLKSAPVQFVLHQFDKASTRSQQNEVQCQVVSEPAKLRLELFRIPELSILPWGWIV